MGEVEVVLVAVRATTSAVTATSRWLERLISFVGKGGRLDITRAAVPRWSLVVGGGQLAVDVGQDVERPAQLTRRQAMRAAAGAAGAGGAAAALPAANGRVGVSDVARLETAVLDLYDADDKRGGAVVFGDVLAERGQVQILLNTAMAPRPRPGCRSWGRPSCTVGSPKRSSGLASRPRRSGPPGQPSMRMTAAASRNRGLYCGRLAAALVERDEVDDTRWRLDSTARLAAL